MDNSYLPATIVILFLLWITSSFYKAGIDRALDKIPTVGGSGILSSYIGAVRFLFDARDMIQEGYVKFPDSAFKVPCMSKWMVVVSGRALIDELRRAPEDHISAREANIDVIQLLYTMRPQIPYDSYHVDVLKVSLARSLANHLSDVEDEIISAVKAHIPLTDEWSSILAYPMATKIISRTSNRLFVGLPLCRNPDYQDLNIEFTIDVMKAAQIISVFPNFLKPLVGRCFTKIGSQIERAIRHLDPIIQERLDKDTEYGRDWPERPNDVLSSLLDLPPAERTIQNLTSYILAINFGAIHTTSMAFTQALFDLAANPSIVPALREEVEKVMNEEGCSRVSLHKMVMLDSFLKESQRLGGGFAVSMQRKVLKDFTFSDGTVVPKGNHIGVANFALHRDEKYYPDPLVFDAFRFSKTRETEVKASSKRPMHALSHEYMVFGHGKRACPGRFFAINEMKVLLAHILLNYDVALENESPRPADYSFGVIISPDPAASIMFRKRRV